MAKQKSAIASTLENLKNRFWYRKPDKISVDFMGEFSGALSEMYTKSGSVLDDSNLKAVTEELSSMGREPLEISDKKVEIDGKDIWEYIEQFGSEGPSLMANDDREVKWRRLRNGGTNPLAHLVREVEDYNLKRFLVENRKTQKAVSFFERWKGKMILKLYTIFDKLA
jgi:hypothetical protein